MSKLTNATSADFDELVLQSTKPVLVDFWAEWCGPCRALGPILDQISEEHGEKITVVKLNVDENPEISERYRITSLPTMHVFSGGEIVKTIVGAKPKPAIQFELADFIQ